MTHFQKSKVNSWMNGTKEEVERLCVAWGEGVMWGKTRKRCKALNGRITEISVETLSKSTAHLCGCT